ncbi:hypothetical protein DFP72DRAFT_875079 [Ephemerocybe angulata]|uniref:Uncharacterized protein n=1 Tax=Ephemerocybe angulata TaxID=980116 RepID=A0A8H6IFG5_9AGAR|nr:hypothetical protein DFP72DRAFT_875079 [Tulosesus angulatus]
MASSTTTQTAVTDGSLYLAGFSQVDIPHVALILAINGNIGKLAHVKYISESEEWQYEYKTQNIANSLSLTSLHLIHDASKPGAAPIPSKVLDDFCKTIEVPSASETSQSQCGVWMGQVLHGLVDKGIIAAPASGVDALLSDFVTWAKENRKFATRSKYPNIRA